MAPGAKVSGGPQLSGRGNNNNSSEKFFISCLMEKGSQDFGGLHPPQLLLAVASVTCFTNDTLDVIMQALDCNKSKYKHEMCT
jgi:hypothetical protein